MNHKFLQLSRTFVLSTMVVLSASLFTPSVDAQSVGLPDFTQIIERADPAVVNIRTTKKVSAQQFNQPQDPAEMFRWFFGPDFERQFPQQPRRQAPNKPDDDREIPSGQGSGFFISSDGYILTNHHVVTGASEIYVTLTNKQEYKATVVGSDERTDVALIKIDVKGMPSLPIGDPNNLRKGEWVVAIGSPFGLESTVTAGIVSAKGRDTGDYLSFIQSDVAVNPGNSGGPLLNMNGEVVGINSQIISRSGGFMGISLSIPINEAMRVVDQLKVSGRVVRGKIGVQITDVSKELAETIGLDKPQGAMIRAVEEDSAAEKAGIEAGDVILQFGDIKIERFSDLPRAVGETKPGSSVKVQLWRLGQLKTVSVKVDEIKADVANDDTNSSNAVGPSNLLGLGVKEIDETTRQTMRIRSGVLIDTVVEPSASLGLQQGDILLAIDRKSVSSVSQFNKLVAQLEPGKSYALLVRREGLTQWLTIKTKAK